MKPILFNTDMVRAILDGRKTVTRRVVKPHFRQGEIGWQVITEKHSGKYVRIEYLDEWENETRYMIDPFRTGDILYVRETWAYGYVDTTDFECRCNECFFEELKAGTKKDSFLMPRYFYRTENLDGLNVRWRPSIHMPKEAARIFLRVTDVRAERLWRMDTVDALAEGMRSDCPGTTVGVVDAFCKLWDTTIKPADLPLYGWDANTWVWVIEFERVSKEAALKGGEG